ncbi:MAG: hypothetical protein QOD94_633 [Alphaproteobacteria bacterium]|nr:hypothetical protein [Alphaproteobacteria bacterium]
MRVRLLAIALAALASFTIFTSTSASAQGTPLFAVLLGGNECDGANPPLCRQGDTNAYGSATVILVSSPTPRICFGITVDNVGPVEFAHIHTGQTGINGPIFINMSPASIISGDPNAWAGCTTTGVTAQKLAQIRANPANFYVNVHTTVAGGFPGGALRGQLF